MLPVPLKERNYEYPSDHFGSSVNRRDSSMALQPQLGTVPERRSWPASADRCNSDVIEGVLT